MESEALNFLLIEKSNCRTHEIGKGSLDACKENFEGLGFIAKIGRGEHLYN